MKTQLEKYTGSEEDLTFYDFAQPDILSRRFMKKNIETLQYVSETFARLSSSLLSSHLKSEIEIKFQKMDYNKHEKFCLNKDKYSAISVISTDPIAGSAILHIDSHINHAVIHKLFGASAEKVKTEKPSRPLTWIEISVTESFVVYLLGVLRESWKTILDMRPRLGAIKEIAEAEKIFPRNDMVMLFTFLIRFGENTGKMNLILHHTFFEQLPNFFSSTTVFPSDGGSGNSGIVAERMKYDIDCSLCRWDNLSGDLEGMDCAVTKAESGTSVFETRKP